MYPTRRPLGRGCCPDHMRTLPYSVNLLFCCCFVVVLLVLVNYPGSTSAAAVTPHILLAQPVGVHLREPAFRTPILSGTRLIVETRPQRSQIMFYRCFSICQSALSLSFMSISVPLPPPPSHLAHAADTSPPYPLWCDLSLPCISSDIS